MARLYNFNPGPATLPEVVLKQAQEELLDWQGKGLSVLEMSHRSPDFLGIAERAEASLRRLLQIPAHYRILFLQGGASGMNAAIPLNLTSEKSTIDFINTGHWSKRSIAEAEKFANVHIAASSEDNDFTYVPTRSDWVLSKNPAYLHICANETISGLEYQFTPDTGAVPLVADMSSNILSRWFDINRFGLVYAGAQKNIGPAGVTLVIVREDLLGQPRTTCPSVWNFTLQAKTGWMYNTPPTFSVYLAGLVFAWIEARGGLTAMEKINREKSALLYAEVDRTGFYHGKIALYDRSRMNVTFNLPSVELEAKFVAEAKEQGLLNLKGHKVAGGIRASIYNAMPIEGVKALIGFMREFEQRNG